MEMLERPPQARHLAVMTAKRPLVRGPPPETPSLIL